MLITYLFRDPVYWVLPLIIQIVSYYKILTKMGKRPYLAILPIAGEMEMSTDLCRRMRSFWRPAIFIAVLFITTRYLGMDNEYSYIMAVMAYVVYGIFLARLYWRLAKQFGKKKGFGIGLILLPLIFLPVLAFDKKNVYLGPPQFKPEPYLTPRQKRRRNTGYVAASLLELVVMVVGCFFITVIVHPFRPVAQYMMNDTINQLKDVTDTDEIVGRDVTMGEGYEKVVEKQRTRDYFFPDHSGDKKVVVMEYIIGSDLEDGRGFASINIAQMKDATAKGEALDFVIQAGGADRWFTKGIDDSTIGRYVISGGNLEKAELLDDETCMSEPDNLTDFIKWTKENHPADRYMLVLWDHGGGFASGYGWDDLNVRENGTQNLKASEIISAIKKSGVKFDVIGFDACLMQNVEYAYALEPCADYYLASEETEPGTGWFYTAGFGKLAADPTMPTVDFAKSIISAYDQCNRALNDGEPNPMGTLSLVDLTLIKPVYKELTDLYEQASEDMTSNPGVFANMSAARSGAYQFYDDEQVDMVSFITNLKNADYKQQVMSDKELDKMAEIAKAAVVYRNSDSGDGCNGLAIDFPYKSLDTYSAEYQQLKAVKYKKEQNFFDRFCSIMAAQQKKSAEDNDDFFAGLMTADYTNEDWYVEGFEDYDTADLFVDIPVKEGENGYRPELPEKTWDTILDCKIDAYVETDDGLMYIGREHFYDDDGEGHPVVALDGIWANINGHLVCYETEEPMVTEDGVSYRGTVKARLNGTENITIHIEWDPVKEESEDSEESEEEVKGHVTGYSVDGEKKPFFTRKGLEQFETGDSIEFLFEFYNEQGDLIDTKPYGNKLTVITDDILQVSDELLNAGTVVHYYGVLTDIYQRDLMTEEIVEQVQ